MDPLVASFNSVIREVKKDSLSVKNRLQSIIADSYFVDEFYEQYDIPLVANERCGSWYVKPNIKKASCYFKSTDGHTNEIRFSHRRLNFHLLTLISKYGSIAIVDSTRTGKSMPDALSKTVPIWCAVFNQVLFNEFGDQELLLTLGIEMGTKEAEELLRLKNEYKWLVLPKDAVSKNETSLISENICALAVDALRAGVISKDIIKSKLNGNIKPFVPQWYYPGCNNKPKGTSIYYDIICITASMRAAGKKNLLIKVGNDNTSRNTYECPYVQGAGDDHELWTSTIDLKLHFESQIWWNNVYYIDGVINEACIDKNSGFLYESLSNEELLKYLGERTSKYTEKNLDKDFMPQTFELKHDGATTNIIFGRINSNVDYVNLSEAYRDVSQVIVCSSKFHIQNIEETPEIRIFHCMIESSKKGSKELRKRLPELIEHIDVEKLRTSKILILCESGIDLSVGIVLILLARNFDLDWKFGTAVPRIDKIILKQHLSRISNVTFVNPSRNTLQSVNSYLM